MPVFVKFTRREDHIRAVGILSEAEETYSGIDKETIQISNAAVRMLRAEGINFNIIGEEVGREEKP